MAALLCRELTNASLAELSKCFGLSHPDSSAYLIKKAKKMIKDAKPFKKQYNQIKQYLLKTENQVCPQRSHPNQAASRTTQIELLRHANNADAFLAPISERVDTVALISG